MKGMKKSLLILDDWEGKLKSNVAWEEIRSMVQRIDFLNEPFDAVNAVNTMNTVNFSDVGYVVAVRERTAINEAFLRRFPSLELILQTGGHAYHIDAAAVQSRHIKVLLGRSIEAPLYSIPELTFCHLLNAYHRIPEAQRAMTGGAFPLLLGRTLRGRRLGILGLGRHGKNVAAMARAFGMEIVAWNRENRTYNNTDQEIPRLSLSELLSTSDVVSLHLKYSDSVYHIISAEQLSLMKQCSVLINTSRGKLINETHLIAALKNGPLSYAGLDVFEVEPLPANSELRTLPNVSLSPHVGWTTEEVFEEFSTICTRQLKDFLSNSPQSFLYE